MQNFDFSTLFVPLTEKELKEIDAEIKATEEREAEETKKAAWHNEREKEYRLKKANRFGNNFEKAAITIAEKHNGEI